MPFLAGLKRELAEARRKCGEEVERNIAANNRDIGLREEISRLRAALEPFASCVLMPTGTIMYQRIKEIPPGAYYDAARAALADPIAAVVAWAVGRWEAEVKNRPLRNRHRRALDDTWRQIIRHCGGDHRALCGPTHDELLDAEHTS